MAGQVAGRDGAAYVQRLGGAQQELGVGVRGEGGVEVQGVGEVEVALDVHGPGDTDLGQVHVEVADLGGGEPVGLGLVGVEPGGGFLDQPAQLGGADLVGDRGDVGVHERRRRRGQGHGAVGDVAEPEGLQVTGLEPFPAAPEPVAALDGLGEEAAPGLGGAAQRGGELDHRELRDLRAALRHPAAEPTRARTRARRRPARPPSRWSASPPTARRPSSPRGRRRPRPASGPARGPAPRRGRRTRRAEAGRSQRSSWDQHCHRPPTVGGPESPIPQGIPKLFSESSAGSATMDSTGGG